MSKDYYKTLSVDKGASASDIKKAFHKLAMKYHPDKPEGDEAKFKEINEAYQVLSDDKKRAQYDQFGSAGPQGFGGGGFGGFGGFNGQNMHFDFGGANIDLDDIFSMFGGGFGGQRVRRGRDFQMDVELSFKEAVQGVKKEITIPASGDQKERKVSVDIPAGIDNGQRVKLSGYGESIPDGQPGNLYLMVRVQPHKILRREGNHLVAEIEVKLTDAILGAKYEIEGVDGPINIKIPAGLKSGEVLRVRGKGIPGGMFSGGDLLIQTHIKIPKKLSKDGKKAIEMLREEGL